MNGHQNMTPTSRLVRGWLSAAMATFLAAASHAAAGGTVPLVAVVVSLVAGGLVCVILAGRRLTLPRVVVGVAASQLVFHGLFGMFATSGGNPDGAVAAPHHLHGASTLMASPGLAHTPDASGMSALMLLSHLLAGVAGVALIRHADHLWWALLAILCATIDAIMVVARHVPIADARRLMAFGDGSPFLYDLLHCDTRRRLRGPPLLGIAVP